MLADTTGSHLVPTDAKSNSSARVFPATFFLEKGKGNISISDASSSIAHNTRGMYEIIYLRLYICDLVCREAEFIERHFRFLEEAQEPELARK